MPGVPANVAQGGHLSEEVEYRNHTGVRCHANSIAKKVVADFVPMDEYPTQNMVQVFVHYRIPSQNHEASIRP